MAHARGIALQMFFDDNIDTPKYLNFLYGLGASMLT
jgi:hypothetical protein